MLASPIEILTKYHNETIKKLGKRAFPAISYKTSHLTHYILTEKKMSLMDVEHKVTRIVLVQKFQHTGLNNHISYTWFVPI